MGRRQHEHHLSETAASADPHAGAALLAPKDEQITTLDARLHETISRLSLVRARLLTTLDQLDALQATHSAALASAARERRLLETRVQEAEERAREGEKERMDMRDAVKVLVERVESTPDFSKWPRAQIRLSSPCEPSVVSSKTSYHPNSNTTSNAHPPPSPSKSRRKAKPPPASSSSNQPLPQPLSLSPSAPNHQSDSGHQSDQLAYASTLISHFRGERDAALVRLRESEQRVFALEARVARRDAALEACAGCERCLGLVGTGRKRAGGRENGTEIGRVDGGGCTGEVEEEVDEEGDADILNVSIERNQELEREVQELARQLDRERISHQPTREGPPSREERPPQTHTRSQPRIRTSPLSDPESPVSQPHVRPRTPEPPSPLSPLAGLSPLSQHAPHSATSPKPFNNPADNSLISSLSFSPSSSTSSTATSPSRRPGTAGTAGTATPRQYPHVDVAEQSFDSGVYDAEDEEEEQGHGHGRDQTRLDERPIDIDAEPPLDPGKQDTDAVLFSAHVAAVPVPALHALEKEVARLGRKIDAFVVQRRDVERDLARFDAGPGDFGVESADGNGDGDVGDKVRRRRHATATTITSPAAAATTAPRREGSRTAAGGSSTDRGQGAGLNSEMGQRDRSAVIQGPLRNVGGGYMRAPAAPTGDVGLAEPSRVRESASTHTSTLPSHSASPRHTRPTRSPSRARPHPAAAAAGDQAQTPVVEYAHPHHGACEATLLAARRREMELRERVRHLEEQLQVQQRVASEGVERSESVEVEVEEEQGESAERPRQLVEVKAPIQHRVDTAVQTESVLPEREAMPAPASEAVEDFQGSGSNFSERGTESGDAGPTERDEMAERVHEEVMGEEEGEMPMELATPLVPLRSFVAEPEDEVVGGEDGEVGVEGEASGHGPDSDSDDELLNSSGRPDEAMGASEGGATPPHDHIPRSSPVSNHEDALIATRPNTPSPAAAGPPHPRQRSGSPPHEQSPPTTRPSAPSPPSSPEGSPTIAVGLLPPLLPNAHLSLPLPLSLPLLHAPRSSARSPHPTSTSGVNCNTSTNTTVARTRVSTNTRTATSMGLRRAHTDTALQNNWDADADAEARRAGAVHRFVLYRATSSFVAELREVERNLAERAVEAQVQTEAEAEAEEEEKDVHLPEESRDETEADEMSGSQANVDPRERAFPPGSAQPMGESGRDANQ